MKNKYHFQQKYSLTQLKIDNIEFQLLIFAFRVFHYKNVSSLAFKNRICLIMIVLINQHETVFRSCIKNNPPLFLFFFSLLFYESLLQSHLKIYGKIRESK